MILLTLVGRSSIFWAIISVALLVVQSDFVSITFGLTAAALQYQHGDWHLKHWGTALLAVVAVASAAMLSNQMVWPIFSISIVLLLARPAEKSSGGLIFGGISYPLYLNHWIGGFPSHSLVKHLPILMPAHNLLTAFFGLVAGVVMYLLVDRPVMAARNSYYSESLGRQLRLFAYANISVGIFFGITRWYILPLIIGS